METMERHGIWELASERIDISSRAATLQTTYVLLAASVLCAAIGGYIGSENDWIVEFFTSIVGLIVALLLLNAIPMLAVACLRSPGLGLLALGVDGFVSGIVISPAIYAARLVDARIILIALGMTAAVFAAVTICVGSSRKVFSAPRALGFGVFASLVAAVILNHYLQFGLLGIMLSAGLGVFGTCALVINTSRILHDPESVGAIPGALLLFSGIFNIFVGLLNLLLRLTSRD
jgi:modulator of FtsH protease